MAEKESEVPKSSSSMLRPSVSRLRTQQMMEDYRRSSGILRSRFTMGLMPAGLVAAMEAGTIGDEQGQMKIYENTYRLEPYNPFSPDKAKKVLQTKMDGTLKTMKYDPNVCSKVAKDLSIGIRDELKKMFDRYRIVCHIQIFENKFQGKCTITHFIWDAKRDNFADHKYENPEILACGVVYGIYYD